MPLELDYFINVVYQNINLYFYSIILNEFQLDFQMVSNIRIKVGLISKKWLLYLILGTSNFYI